MAFSTEEQFINAVLDNNVAVVEQLLGNGVDINYQTTQGSTALHIAAQQQLPAIAELLISHHATVDIEDDFGNTPLWAATFNSRGDGAVIKILLANNADPDHKNHNDKSPRELANTIANYDVKQYYS